MPNLRKKLNIESSKKEEHRNILENNKCTISLITGIVWPAVQRPKILILTILKKK